MTKKNILRILITAGYKTLYYNQISLQQFVVKHWLGAHKKSMVYADPLWMRTF
jgi:hypothetical protein